MASHTAHRPLHCAVCGRGFHQTEDLKRHIRFVRCIFSMQYYKLFNLKRTNESFPTVLRFKDLKKKKTTALGEALSAAQIHKI